MRFTRRTVMDRGRSWPTGSFAFEGLTALAMLACLVTVGCDVDPTESPDPAVEPEPGSAPDPQLGAGQNQAGTAGPDSAAAAQPEAFDEARDAGAGTERQIASAADTPRARARADLAPTEGNDVHGTVDFIQRGETFSIHAMIAGLEPGAHGIHVHEVGDCSAPDASSAGDHFTPESDPHGAPNDVPSEHHAGDLGNISADESGAAEKQMAVQELEITGEFGVVGRAVIVHQGEDDLTSQPSGASGDPVACGVVRVVEETRSTDRV